MSKEEARTETAGRSVEVIFDVLREGVALCQMIRDSSGKVVDYRICEANEAYVRGLGGKSAIGKTLRELRPDVSQRWYDMWGRLMEQGEPTRFEYQDRTAGRWYDVYVTPLANDQIAHIYVDVTHRKQTEAHLAHLLNELNHRVKNNLMMVTAMLTMQARASGRPEVQAELQQAIDRIQTISEVHAILYKTGAVEKVRFDAYLDELCRRLAATASHNRVQIELESAPLEVASDEAVQMGIVVNELITNAVKHAYPGDAQGKILVKLAPGDSDIRLSVRDFGPGLPPEAERDSGLGMRLVKSLVQKNGGSLHMANDDGLDVQVILPGHGRREADGAGRRPEP